MSSALEMARDEPEDRQPPDEAARKYHLTRDNRSMSTDIADSFRPPRHGDPPRGAFSRPSPYGHQGMHQTPYPHYPEMYGRPMKPHNQIQSVVTTSFSTEERDAASSVSRGRVQYIPNHRYEHDGRFLEDDGREKWGVRNSTPPGPPHGASQPHIVQRSYSSSEYFSRKDPMKRNYYHHSQPTDNSTGELPSDFLPPKRAKHSPGSKKETIVTSRVPSVELATRQEWYSQSGTWDSEDGRYRYLNGRSQSYPNPPAWAGHHYSQHNASPLASRQTKNYPVVSPPGQNQGYSTPRHWHPSPEASPHRWSGQSPSSAWTPMHSSNQPWSPPRSGSRDPAVGRTLSEDTREGYPAPLPYHANKMDMSVEYPSTPTSKHQTKEMPPRDIQGGTRNFILPTGESILLLALPQDRVSLSETLCVVRENVEVFTATKRDVDAPAPGRKHAVVVGQVGLRCIHCRHTTKASDRVKRAVCYPSSIKRIYRTVIDMKLDHFSQCKFVPAALRKHLDDLKSVHTRSTGTTMQYFIRAAHTLGMEDATSGVRLDRSMEIQSSLSTNPISAQGSAGKVTAAAPGNIQRTGSIASSAESESGVSQKSGSMMSTDSFDTTGSQEARFSTADKFYTGLVPLSLPEDTTSLSPLRCFLREQVCAFTATEKDIGARAPTTFSIAVGQVGIGCIHCVKQQANLRSNRAVCFPFSIGRIYQSVADIQRFHLGECKSLPLDVKNKFLQLQSASSKGSKGLATRQYWVTSARKIGLVDTPKGLRFARDPSKPESPKNFSLDILAQVAFSVTTASKQLVLPADKSSIAEFLYVVMEQLQPCRFTEADRNKRRLKDVGCIGVECKHCAGHVDGRKFFWSSVSAVESNFVSVHTHMLECRMIPDSLKERLTELKKLRKEQTAALPVGSQKTFFSRVWERLHNDEFKKDGQQTGSNSTLQQVASDVSMEGQPKASSSQSPEVVQHVHCQEFAAANVTSV